MQGILWRIQLKSMFWFWRGRSHSICRWWWTTDNNERIYDSSYLDVIKSDLHFAWYKLPIVMRLFLDYWIRKWNFCMQYLINFQLTLLMSEKKNVDWWMDFNSNCINWCYYIHIELGYNTWNQEIQIDKPSKRISFFNILN